jgi:adenylate cyclase 10
VRQHYKAREIISDENEKFYHVEELVGQGVKSKSEALAIRAGISDETYLKIAPQIRGCVPAAIIPYLQIGAEQFGSETRSLTVMFASLGVELSSAETQEGMDKIQKIFVCVQQ